MRRSLLGRAVMFTAAASLAMAGFAVPVGAGAYRAASTGLISDPTGDAAGVRAVPAHEPRADLTGAGAVIRRDGRLELTATVAQPTNPVADPAWADGGAAVMWVLDTDGNGLPNHYVFLWGGPQLAPMVVPAEEEGTASASGCDPVAEYSAARYSVSIIPSCVKLPASFGWEVVMGYDAEHADDSGGTADNAPNGDALASGPGTLTDPTGDVVAHGTANDPRADITAATLVYEPGRIDVTATLASPTDPRVDANWADGLTEVGWYFDTDGDDEPDYVAALGAEPNLTVGVYDASGGDDAIRCTVLATYTATGYAVTLDPACIGSPARLWWGVVAIYDDGGQAAVDLAPDLSMSGPVTAATLDPQARPSGAGGQSGYWMMTDHGDVYAFGDARPLGGHAGNRIVQVGVDIESTPTGNGYWILDTTGAVFPKGDARAFGEASGHLQPGERAAALSATPTGDGYWIFTDRGRALAYGAAVHRGDMAGTKLNGAILDSVATPTGRGYWMVGSDGGIFSFGDAAFSGSAGDIRLNKPVMSMAADPDGRGYWLVASDGGIFAFEAPFYGSMGATRLNKPISGMVPGAAGYLMVAEDGGIFTFGNVAFHGSLGNKPPLSPVVAVALAP